MFQTSARATETFPVLPFIATQLFPYHMFCLPFPLNCFHSTSYVCILCAFVGCVTCGDSSVSWGIVMVQDPFAGTPRLICKSSVRIFWHVPNAIPTSSATSLIVRRRSARIISRTRATVSSVWEVDGLPGRGSSSKDRRPFWKREYHSNVFDRLRQDSPKAACNISYVSAPVFPRRKQKSMHTRC